MNLKEPYIFLPEGKHQIHQFLIIMLAHLGNDCDVSTPGDLAEHGTVTWLTRGWGGVMVEVRGDRPGPRDQVTAHLQQWQIRHDQPLFLSLL